jgi:ribosomal protein L37E
MPEEKQPKFRFRVEFWQENVDHKPVHTDWIWATSPKMAKIKMRNRALEEARKTGDFRLHSLFVRDDVHIMAIKDKDHPDNPLDEEDKLVQEMKSKDVKNEQWCKECGEALDDDYCSSCGWRRQSWFSRAKTKLG